MHRDRFDPRLRYAWNTESENSPGMDIKKVEDRLKLLSQGLYHCGIFHLRGILRISSKSERNRDNCRILSVLMYSVPICALVGSGNWNDDVRPREWVKVTLPNRNEFNERAAALSMARPRLLSLTPSKKFRQHQAIPEYHG